MSAKHFTAHTFRTLLSITVCAAVWGSVSAASATEKVAPSPFGQYLAGRHAEQVGEDFAALRFYGHAAKDKLLSTADLYRRIHILALTEGRIEDALKALDALERAGGTSPFANLLRATHSIKAENYALVEKQFDTEKVGLVRLLAPAMKAWAHVGNGNIKGAMDTLEDMKSQAGLVPIAELQIAMINEIAGNAEEAEQHYLRVLDKGGLTLRVAELVGRYYERIGKFENTRELYTKYDSDGEGPLLLAQAEARHKAGKRPPLDIRTPSDGVAEVFFNFAGILQVQPGDERATILAHLALYLRPDFPHAKLTIAKGLEETERFADANAIYADIPKTSPLSWMARRSMADNLDQMGQTDDAVRLFRALAKERPGRVTPLVELANVLRRHERFKDAIEAYSEALSRVEKETEQFWTVYYTRGIAYEQTQQWAKAEKDFLRALDLKPDQPEVLNYLGYSWIDQGLHLEKAIAMIEKAVDLRPRDGYIVDSLGWGLYRLGKYAEATKKLERAVMLRPADPVINDHLGDALWRVGRTREARFQWEHVKTLGPDEKLIETLKDKLQNGLKTQAVEK